MAGPRLAAFRLYIHHSLLRGCLRLHVSFYFCLGLFLLMPLGVLAQDRDILLRAELQVDLEQPPSVLAFEGVTEPGYVPVLTDQAAADAVRAEGLWLFAGMIHGFDFVYTPSDRARDIADFFEIQPRASIPSSSPAIKVAAVRLEGRLLVVDVEYLVPVPERTSLASWTSISYRSTQGRGGAPAWDRGLSSGANEVSLPFQVLARRAAIIDASREALRDHLRGMEFNKPREVRGSFAFATNPRLVLTGGRWIATVRLRVGVDEIIPYGGY